MQSFRTELENLDNPVVEQDIIDLAAKIEKFHGGDIDPDKFRSLRLARGVYGQRQPGNQMVRIKIPFGKMTIQQMRRIADISTEYGGGNLHATTRQDIQIHYVSLDRTPELWAKLEQDDITLREACGNTVRNVTGSPIAGVDPNEPFDVSPYAQAVFKYFLRNPICQAMGRKFKISFSSSEKDTGISFIHDIGYIPKIKMVDGKEVRGFKVMIGGGLGAQPAAAVKAYDFLEEDQIIPFAEALLRVFDRYGERKRRVKARFKFLLADIGLEEVMKLIQEEWKSLSTKSYKIDTNAVPKPALPATIAFSDKALINPERFALWKETNVHPQKQEGYYYVEIKVPNGDIGAAKAHKFADIIGKYAADDIRVTVNQGYILRYVKEDSLKSLFTELDDLNLANPGFDSTADIIACAGTDTCNLGISNSTRVALELENVIEREFPELIKNNDIKIKISGCPNSCGHHGIASIGFHGSSLKNKANKKVLPAVQVLLGGGIDKDGDGYIAEKVIKVPSKKAPDVLRVLFNDYDDNAEEGEYYATYFRRQGKDYFYQLLKFLADTDNLVDSDYVDWGKDQQFKVETEVGECAGVIIDLFATLMFEAEEKAEWAKQAYELDHYADSIYHAYNVFINGAKALLVDRGVSVNTQAGIMQSFDEEFGSDFEGVVGSSYTDFVLRIKQNEPTKEWAEKYIAEADAYLARVKEVQAAEAETV
ncbi:MULTISPECIES: HEPN domain-containing protein [Reichenbachiella]|uniref:Sulfite reductase (Ferredoxin) n=1 Tax=Reichenbachiella agariperforans TaxID=156994 RepID=A0A1M6TGK0_REIAG|nr:HEPN domain-containing protein [Reichenbachiella agariperforans]RJE71502.1 nitrite reductase [Reichenbachiella sp. MSK19-1]SHK56053.1 sulfite reductase (ferredoxin) [Reichenbachiella agariperforans]